jgi:anti-sigma B factor antagonist
MILEADFEPIDLTTAVFRLTGRMTLGLRLREVETKISAGLGVLMILYGNMKVRGGQLRLIGPGAKVLEVLKMTHTDSLLPIDRTLEAALAA